MLIYHQNTFQTLFTSALDRALGQHTIPTHSPGSVTHKTIQGESYAYWRVYQADGRRTEEYLGKRDDPATNAIVAERQALGQARSALSKDAKTLRKAGFAAVDNSVAVTLVAMFNAGLFAHGGVLLGAHAFGALLNHLGAAPVKNSSGEGWSFDSTAQTPLAIPENPSFIDRLKQSGLYFAAEPELTERRVLPSFKGRGSMLKVDLLVSGRVNRAPKPLPALEATAIGLPYFDYLVSNPQTAVILGRDQIIPVQVPNPARFALHGLSLGATHYQASSGEPDPGLMQAAAILEVLLKTFPDSVDSALAALPGPASKQLTRGADVLIESSAPLQPETVDFLGKLRAVTARNPP